ncbi:MAG TPA: serine/threonine-protein kinase, partial [Labilithrix sp.]|nr:serine/threonine-protein kinase [Labilithrix sp.]
MRRFALQPGDFLEGRYELLREWSSGGMGTVWLARVRGYHGFEKLFAVKTLLPQFANDESFRTMFVDEARIVAQIRHGNVVGVEHLGDHQGTIYLALEWVQGGSWSDLIKACHRANTLPIDVMLRIAAGACAGLHAAHELRSEDGALLNVVHRDVSPQNVLIAEAGTTRLIDFGIAKSLGRSSEKTQAGLIKAKLEYASPEQVNFRAVDRRADLWGLGVILHYVFAGYLPFEAASDVRLILAISEGRLKPMARHVPRAVADVVHKALQVDPAARFQTAAEMRSAIEACIGSPTPPETVAACLRELLGGPLAARRQDIRRAIEESNRRGPPSAGAASQAPPRAPQVVALPTAPPELAQRE